MPNGASLISHLLYADYAIIIGEWSDANILNVVRILRVFYMCSGLKINLSKSNLYGIGMDMDEVNNTTMVVGCNAESTPFKYLGLMVGANMNRVNNWKSVYDICEARLSRWKPSLLFIGGRIMVIKSILESFPNYYFCLYKAPVKVIRDLESMIKRFLWGGSGD
ncbi:uncharacterized protein LOC110869633 [Helianthus annuus]|uniref:uncharacterized protein LOC110869633 n=1 Tax=Helianthus annuus TaxID=4232 RepID=UPI000B90A339|nr:uncharacterized protein LOC110869633 [Helianthus annuus]